MPILWKRFLRWSRWRQRRPGRGDARVLSIVLALLALDQATKHTLTTQDWAWHEQPTSWLYSSLLIVALTSLLLLTDTFRWAGACLVAGGLGNVLSELVYNQVANPFQAQTAHSVMAFNAADVMLAVGMALLPISGVQLFIRIVKEQPA